MAEKPHAARIGHILDAIDEVHSVVAEIAESAFSDSRRMRFVVERAFEIISEATRHLPDDLKARHPDIPWRDIADIGNLLRHEYQRVDTKLLWKYAQHDLAPLERVCKAELAREQRQEIVREQALKAGRGSRADERDRDD
jgi:uncharacterized protein with HEPN domain